MSEADSIMEWLRYRVNQCSDSRMVRAYQRLFVAMWEEEFGSTDSIPKDFKEEIESKFRLYRRNEDVKPRN